MNCLLSLAKREDSKLCKLFLKCLFWSKNFRKSDYDRTHTHKIIFCPEPTESLLKVPKSDSWYQVPLIKQDVPTPWAPWLCCGHLFNMRPLRQDGPSQPQHHPAISGDPTTTIKNVTYFRVNRASASLDMMKAFLSSSNITCKFL